MRNKYLVKGDLVKGLRSVGIKLPDAVQLAKKYDKGVLTLEDIITEHIGNVISINTSNEYECASCGALNYDIVYKNNYKGNTIIIHCHKGCSGMYIARIDKNDKTIWVSSPNGDIVYAEPLIKVEENGMTIWRDEKGNIIYKEVYNG